MSRTIRPSPSGPPITLFELSDAALGLRSDLFVDSDTLIPTAEQDGSVLAPYATITQAVDFANASNTTRWYIRISFGNYSNEAPITLLPERLYVFEGVVRGPVICQMPNIIWTVTGHLTSAVLFRTIAVGLVTILDGSPAATDAVISYESAECRGLNAATTSSHITILMSGLSIANFQGLTTTAVNAVARTLPITVLDGVLIANNVQFEITCSSITVGRLFSNGCSFIQDIYLSDTSFEARRCLWIGSGHLMTFTGSAGVARLDTGSQNAFNEGNVTLVNGSFIAADQTYDSSSAIPIPEGTTTGQATFALPTTFVGASYRVSSYVLAAHCNIQITAAAGGGATLVVAFYQAIAGQTNNPVTLVGVASLAVTTTGVHTLLLATPMRLVPGVVFILVGRVSGAGTLTARTYAAPTQDMLNDPTTVPADAHPTAFTTNITVNATPPATINPNAGGGVFTPSGASNLTPIVRF